MATEDVKLLGSWTSPFVLRVRITLAIKRIEYDYLEQKLIQKGELLLKSNPVHKKVPVLLHEGNPICESLIIVQYLDEVFTSGDPILPSHPYDRATARFWAAYIDDKWFIAMRDISVVEGEEAKKEKVKQVKEGLILLEEAFIKCSKGNDFFGGDKIGFIDIVFGSCLQWVNVIQKMNKLDPFIDQSNTPNLYKWAKKFSSHDCVKDWIPDVDKLAEFAKLLFAKLRADAQKLGT